MHNDTEHIHKPYRFINDTTQLYEVKSYHKGFFFTEAADDEGATRNYFLPTTFNIHQ